MGIVLAARHELLGVQVAVKVLSPERVRQPNALERFLREARAVAQLKSEHVARVMDVGTTDSQQPYIVMEMLEGEDLQRRLERGPLGVAQAVDVILQALDAIAQAHSAGIVHRDLKPGNLFLAATPDAREIVKVLDFGIAKLTDTRGGTGSWSGELTGEHSTLGSPSYMAPEQVRASRDIDPRADIWALGAILYELLTGMLAFDGASLGEIFEAVLTSTPLPLRSVRPEAPEALEAVIDRCLARDREERFADVAELARAVAPFGSGAWKGHVARIERTLEPTSHRRPRTGPELVRASLVTEAEELVPASTLTASGKGKTPVLPWLAAGAVIMALVGFAAFGRARSATRGDPQASPGIAPIAAAVAPPPAAAPPVMPAPAPAPGTPGAEHSAPAGRSSPPAARPAPVAAPPPRSARSRYPALLSSPE
jgi:serine/threonine protein kinase